MSNPQFTEVSHDYWDDMWKKEDIGFHRDHVDLMLEKHIGKLINGRQGMKIFVPLCGKSVDMKWLWDQGHTVIGVESVRCAVEEFFKEQAIKYTVSDLPDIGGSLFTSEDERIKLYCCDLFKFHSKLEDGMNAVWDRGSLVAINRDERQRYAELLTSLLSPDCRYLLDTLEYDEAKYPGPPFYVSEEAIHILFGEKLNITRLDRKDIFGKTFESWGISSLHENLFLMKVK